MISDPNTATWIRLRGSSFLVSPRLRSPKRVSDFVGLINLIRGVSVGISATSAGRSVAESSAKSMSCFSGVLDMVCSFRIKNRRQNRGLNVFRF